jgi:predicted N-acetyltransferase YhbS
MPIDDITIRPLRSPSELAIFGRLTVESFFRVPPQAAADVAAGWLRILGQRPGFAPEQRRGAFRDGTYLGGYLIQERELRLGAAAIPTGCIGSVVTVPAFRRQGVASALLADALAFARERRLGLLLLDGIPNFYARFGYTDVFDVTLHALDRAAIDAALSGPPPAVPISVRPATRADTPALLAAYNRHYGTYTGSFVRSLAEQEWLLRVRGPDNAPLVAAAADGTLAGYLYFGWGGDRAYALEAAAENWPAALALLRAQVEALDGDASAAIRWRLPRGGRTYELPADHLVAPADVSADEPAQQASVRSETFARANAGWMARIGSLEDLIRAVLPEWRARLANHRGAWEDAFALTIGDQTFTFTVGEQGLKRVEAAAGAPLAARLSPQVFAQLLFGFRPVSWAALQPGQHVPEPQWPLLAALFPLGHACIPGTDDF